MAKAKTAPEMRSVADWAEDKAVPDWMAAAMVKLEDWTEDKAVTEAEFDQALARFRTRRQGG